MTKNMKNVRVLYRGQIDKLGDVLVLILVTITNVGKTVIVGHGQPDIITKWLAYQTMGQEDRGQFPFL